MADEEIIYKIEDFIVDSNHVDDITDKYVTINHNGDFVEFKNHLSEILILNETKHYQYYTRSWGYGIVFGQWEKKEDEITNKEHNISPGETKRFVLEERREEFERTDVDYTISLVGVGSKGEDVTLEIQKAPSISSWWDNIDWAFWITIIALIVVLIIILILWRMGVFRKMINAVSGKK